MKYQIIIQVKLEANYTPLNFSLMIEIADKVKRLLTKLNTKMFYLIQLTATLNSDGINWTFEVHPFQYPPTGL